MVDHEHESVTCSDGLGSHEINATEPVHSRLHVHKLLNIMECPCTLQTPALQFSWTWMYVYMFN